MLVKPSQKILVSLGGGRKEDESLSQLSIIRLDATIELLRQDPDLRVLVMGGYEKSWYPGYNDRFQMPGAKLRERYLSEREIEQSRIITADFGFDTITEAFTARENIRELEIPNIIILTTKTHGLRVRYIFGEIFKRDPHCPHVNGYKLEFHDSTPDDGLLFVEEERLLLEAVKTLFAKKYYIGIYSEEEDERLKIPDPTNKFQWRDENSEYYQKLLRIRRKFPEGPAYYPWIER